MENNPTPTGTTLEVLALYLPYGIEILTPYGRHPLAELSLRDNSLVVAYEHESGPIEWHCQPADCLPVLKPFSQLCDQLPDGTVPAVEAARRVWPECFKDTNASECVYDVGTFACEVIAPAPAGWSIEGRVSVVIFSTGDTEYGNMAPGHNQADYLRSQGFALPVNGRPLIEGADYLAAAPATPATEGAVGG